MNSFIDKLNAGMARLLAWLTLAMVLLGAFNAVARYLGRAIGVNLSSNIYIESQWYLFSLVFLFGAAYTLKKDEHVRVDVIYGRLKPKHKAWIDLTGTLIFLIPFCLLMIWVTTPAAINSWRELEMSNDPGGLARFPIKTMIPLAFLLLLIQGIAWATQLWIQLRDKNET